MSLASITLLLVYVFTVIEAHDKTENMYTLIHTNSNHLCYSHHDTIVGMEMYRSVIRPLQAHAVTSQEFLIKAVLLHISISAANQGYSKQAAPVSTLAIALVDSQDKWFFELRPLQKKAYHG